MYTAKELNIERELLNSKVNKTLNNLISKNLGKSLFTDEEIEDGEHSDVYLTMIHDETGANHDFHFIGIDKDGNIEGFDVEGNKFETGSLTIRTILLGCKIEIIEMLEKL